MTTSKIEIFIKISYINYLKKRMYNNLLKTNLNKLSFDSIKMPAEYYFGKAYENYINCIKKNNKPTEEEFQHKLKIFKALVS